MPLPSAGPLARTIRVAAVIAASLVVFAPAASGQATRTWVSGVGDDVNPCSRTAPCKTLAGSVSKTADGGEINAIDSGGFGAVTITKALTIDLESVLGGILNASTTGVIVNAQPDDDVVLRGLDIHGGNALVPGGICEFAGTFGIRILKARSVTIQNSRISAQNIGISVEPTALNPKVMLDNVQVQNTCTAGLSAVPAAGQTSSVFVNRSTFHNTGTGIRIADRATAWISGSTLFGNDLGLETIGTGAINVYDDVRLIGNAADGTPTAVVPSFAPPTPTPAPTPVPTPVVVATTTTPVPVPAPAPVPTLAPAPTVMCTVPSLKGKTLASARKALTSAHCALGSVRRVAASTKRVGRVLTQKKKAGAVLPRGTKVGITLGRKA